MSAINVTPDSLAGIALRMLQDIVEDFIVDIYCDAQSTLFKIRLLEESGLKIFERRPGLDIRGRPLQSSAASYCQCPHCKRSISMIRYAPHLEKCLGLSGRQSSRNAMLKIGNGHTTSSPASSFVLDDEFVEELEEKLKDSGDSTPSSSQTRKRHRGNGSDNHRSKQRSKENKQR